MRARTIVLLATLLIIVAACAPADAGLRDGAGGTLEGTDWVLTSYEQDGALTLVPDGLFANAEFAAHRINGFSGCNTYSAVYRAGGNTLLVSQPASTRIACPEEALAFEQAYLAALDRSRTYTARRGTLTIFGPQRTTILVFQAGPRNPLRGSWNVNSYSTGPGNVTAVLEGTELRRRLRRLERDRVLRLQLLQRHVHDR